MRSALSTICSTLTIIACTQAPAPAPPAPATVTAAPAPPAAAAQAQARPGLRPEQMAARNDSLAKDRQKHVDDILAKIKGKENLPAGEVFQNIKIFEGRTAAQLVNLMNRGFSNSLGVSCSHCHVTSDFSKEDKPEKQIARDMFAMVGTINGTLLKNIQNIKSENPTVNCGTCHNGRPRPGAQQRAPAG